MNDKDTQQTRSLPSSLWKKATLFGLLGMTGLGLGVVFFGLLELTFYLYDCASPALNAPEEHLKRELVPYLFLQAEPETVMEIQSPQREGGTKRGEARINRYRFRHRPLSKEKPERTVRVFMIGGSVVFNGGTNETTIAGNLESLLKDNPPDATISYEVVNAGMTGYVSTQELILLVTQVIDFHPYIVIVLDGYNDCLVPLSLDDRLSYPYGFKTLEAAWYQSTTVLEGMREFSLITHLTCGSHLLRRLNPNWSYTAALGARRLPKPSDQAVEKADIKKAADLFIMNWKKMADVMESNAIRGFFALQPLPHESAAFSEFYDRVEEQITGLRERYLSYQFISLRTFLQDRPELFYDEIHTYDEGNALYAERLRNELNPLINNNSK